MNTVDMTDGKPIAVLLQSISGVLLNYYCYIRLNRRYHFIINYSFSSNSTYLLYCRDASLYADAKRLAVSKLVSELRLVLLWRDSNLVCVSAQYLSTWTVYFNALVLEDWLLLPTLIPLSGVGTTCCDKDSAIIFTTGRLPSILLETGAVANNCKCSRDQQLNVPSEVRRSSR
jgi:hypothetical protein